MISQSFFSVLCVITTIVTISAQDDYPFTVQKVGELDTREITDGRPTDGSGKHAVWLGDWNGDGVPEYFVSSKKGGTSTFFYSTSETTWEPTSHWYLPSYSVIALDTGGDDDGRPEYLIKTSKFAKGSGAEIEDFADYAPNMGKSYTTVLRITDDPINNPLEIVMTFDRAVPIIQGCLDLDGDGYKDLLVTHHLEKAKFVARYFKGKDDSIDGIPFEQNHQWASTGQDTSMDVALEEHKARWGDLQFIKGGPVRLFAVGTEGKSNHVIYWDYDPSKDLFDADPTILDINVADADENKLRLVSVRALPGAVMLAGQDGAYFFKYNSDDSYQMKPVPGLWSRDETEYSDFWCLNSGRNDGKMVFVVLRKRFGNKKAAMEFRSFDPKLPNPEDQISDILFEIPVQPKAQRITVLRTDNSYNVNLDAKQLIIAHKYGADIFDVVYNLPP